MFKYSFSNTSSNTGEIKYNTPLIKDSTLLEINFYDQAGSNAKYVLESSPTIEIYVHNQNMSAYIYFLGTVNTVSGNKISFNTTYENGQSPELIKPNIVYDVKFEAKSGPSTDTGAWHHTPNTGDATGATGRIFNNAGAIVVGDIANTSTVEGSSVILTANTESYTFNDAVLSTSIIGYESNVIGDNDIPNRKFVVDLANQTLINGGNPAPAQVVSVGVVTHPDNTNQTFLNYKCGVRPSVLSFLYGSYGNDNLDASTRFVYNIVPPEMDQFVFNGNNSMADKDGCLIQFAAGSASFAGRKGGHIQFNSGGNPTSQTNLTNGDIRFICGNPGFANSGRQIYINGERRGVLTNFSDGQMGAYESFCTQPQDFPNNAYISANFAPISSLVPKISLYWENNLISSGGGSSTVDYVQGVLAVNSIVDLTFAGDNKITYTGATTKVFTVTYSYTPTPDSLDRTLEFYFIKNDTANQNPPEVRIPGSRSYYNAQSQVSYTMTISKTFTISLAQNDTIRAFLTNTLNSNTTTIQDINIDIKEI